MKFLYLLLGLALLLGGIYLAILFLSLVLKFVGALLICALVLFGLAVTVLAIGEIISRKK